MSFSELYYKYGQILANEKARYTGNIWHYTSAQGLKGILENHQLWFSDRRFLNDPTECNYLYKLIAKNKDMFKNYNKNFYGLLQKIVNNFSIFGCYIGGFIYIPQFVCFVASFSKSKDNLELWNYYTKSQHSAGYAIKVSAKNIIKSLDEQNYNYIYGEVIYDDKKQVNMIKELLDSYEQMFIRMHGTDEECIIVPEFLYELAYILEFYNIFFKPKAYKNEQEYRFVVHCDGFGEDKNLNKKFRIFNDIFIPYIELDLPSNYVKEIMVSPSVDQNLLQDGLNLFKNSTIYKKANTSLSDIDKRY